MDKVHDAIAWYQKKIGSYDKQLWEQSVEKKLQKAPQYVHSAPRKSVRLKTEYIDVDLIRGSTFAKTKPQVPWVYITRKAIARILFFPFYYNWWKHQTSPKLYAALLVLYLLQVVTVIVYLRNYDHSILEDKPTSTEVTAQRAESNCTVSEQSKSPADNTDSPTVSMEWGQEYSFMEMSFTEVVVPTILMFLLCLIHSQTVLAHISHKPPKRSKEISGVVRKPKMKKASRKGHRSSGNNSSACPDDTTESPRRPDKHVKLESSPLATTPSPASTVLPSVTSSSSDGLTQRVYDSSSKDTIVSQQMFTSVGVGASSDASSSATNVSCNVGGEASGGVRDTAAQVGESLEDTRMTQNINDGSEIHSSRDGMGVMNSQSIGLENISDSSHLKKSEGVDSACGNVNLRFIEKYAVGERRDDSSGHSSCVHDNGSQSSAFRPSQNISVGGRDRIVTGNKGCVDRSIKKGPNMDRQIAGAGNSGVVNGSRVRGDSFPNNDGNSCSVGDGRVTGQRTGHQTTCSYTVLDNLPNMLRVEKVERDISRDCGVCHVGRNSWRETQAHSVESDSAQSTGYGESFRQNSVDHQGRCFVSPSDDSGVCDRSSPEISPSEFIGDDQGRPVMDGTGRENRFRSEGDYLDSRVCGDFKHFVDNTEHKMNFQAGGYTHNICKESSNLKDKVYAQELERNGRPVIGNDFQTDLSESELQALSSTESDESYPTCVENPTACVDTIASEQNVNRQGSDLGIKSSGLLDISVSLNDQDPDLEYLQNYKDDLEPFSEESHHGVQSKSSGTNVVFSESRDTQTDDISDGACLRRRHTVSAGDRKKKFAIKGACSSYERLPKSQADRVRTASLPHILVHQPSPPDGATTMRDMSCLYNQTIPEDRCFRGDYFVSSKKPSTPVSLSATSSKLQCFSEQFVQEILNENTLREMSCSSLLIHSDLENSSSSVSHMSSMSSSSASSFSAKLRCLQQTSDDEPKTKLPNNSHAHRDNGNEYVKKSEFLARMKEDNARAGCDSEANPLDESLDQINASDTERLSDVSNYNPSDSEADSDAPAKEKVRSRCEEKWKQLRFLEPSVQGAMASTPPASSPSVSRSGGGILTRKPSPLKDFARKNGAQATNSSGSDQDGADARSSIRRRRRMSGTPTSASPSEMGEDRSSSAGRGRPSSLGLRIPGNKNKQLSSSENETGGAETPQGSNKATLSSEEWEDRMQSDDTTSSAYSSSCGNSEVDSNEEGEAEDRMEYTTSTLHVINLLHPERDDPQWLSQTRDGMLSPDSPTTVPKFFRPQQGGSPTSSGHVTQPDKVSCVIWEGIECKKVDLTALDIGWAIIDKVDSLPESSDYFLIGLIFSGIIGAVPLFFRYYVNKEWTICYEDLLTMSGVMTKAGELFQHAQIYTWRQNLLMFNGILQRLFLSLLFFFLLSVADRTFKQRLLYAKHFSYLTSSRRARKFSMPHFRLNKVRNIKIWLSLRSYLKRRGPQRSVDVIVSACFLCAVSTVSLISLQMLKEVDSYLDYLCNWELTIWCVALAVFLMRFMTLGLKINKKYRNLSVLITEQINLYLQMEQKPHKKEELILANNVLRLAEDLLKELESPFKISGFSANPLIYNILRVIVLSAFSAVLTEVLGFKLKLHKIKLKG